MTPVTWATVQKVRTLPYVKYLKYYIRFCGAITLRQFKKQNGF